MLLFSCFSGWIININVLSSIIEVNETFILNSLKRIVIFHIGKLETREKRVKEKNKFRPLITQD